MIYQKIMQGFVWLKQILLPGHNLLGESNSSAYKYLQENYVFQIDDIVKTDADIKLKLSVIGSRNTHSVSLFNAVNDNFLLMEIDPRELIKLGYLANELKEHSLFKQKNLKMNWYGRCKAALSLQISQNAAKRMKRYYAYSISETKVVDGQLKIFLNISRTSQMIAPDVTELFKDIFLASQIEPKQLVRLGYEMAEAGLTYFAEVA